MFRRLMAALAVACLLPLAAQAAPSGAIAHWSFDDGTGTDNTGNGHDGVNFGCTSVPGAVGDGMQIQGFQYLQVANDPALNPTTGITVAAWYRPVAFSGSGNDPIVDKGYSAHSWPYYQYHLGVSGVNYPHAPGNFAFNLAIDGAPQGAGTSAFGMQPGVWYHVAGTYDGAFLRFYVNGVVVNSQPMTGTLSTFPTAVRLGAFDNLSFAVQGTIDEVWIYGRGLSAGEVQELYNPLATPTQPTTWGTMKALYVDRR